MVSIYCFRIMNYESRIMGVESSLTNNFLRSKIYKEYLTLKNREEKNQVRSLYLRSEK